MLHEMLSGRNPFRRASTGETISAILRDPAPPLSDKGRAVPPTLQHALRKVLAKDPAERYQDARDLVVDLRTAREELAGRPPRRLRGWHLYALAQNLQYAGRYEEAIGEYRQAMEADPDMGRAYSGLAVLLANTGERDQAMQYWEQCLARLDRMSDRERLRTLGAYYLTKQEPRGAIESYGALVERYPADTSGHANLAMACFFTRNMDEAREEGQKAVDLSPRNVPQHNNLALYALYAGDFETALREAKTVLEMNPEYEKARDAAALALYGLGRREEAVKAYEELARTSSRGASFAAIGLADIALFEGRTEEAITLLSEGAARDAEAGNGGNEGRKLAMLAEAQVATDNRDSAAATAARAMTRNRDASVLHTAARVLLSLGKESSVREVIEELGSHLEADPQAYAKVLEGELLLRRGRPQDAVRVLHDAQAIADTWPGRLTIARAYLEAGAPAEAYSELQDCLRRRGEAIAAYLDDMPTYRMLPSVYYYLGQAQEGLGSPGAPESYQTFVDFKVPTSTSPMIRDALTRLSALD